MQKTKILASIALILFFITSNFCVSSALAVDSDYPAEGINLSEATFEAETEMAEIKNNETAELKESIELLRAELLEMKSGMKQLQAKIVESEMEKLSDQLATLQKEIANEKTGFAEIEIPNFADPAPEPQTLQVTKIEDFVDFGLSKEILKSKDIETAEKIEIIKTNEDSELTEKLEAAESEIEELKAALVAKEGLEKDKAAHAEVVEKAEEIKSAKDELKKVAVEDTMGKLRKNDEADGIRETSNIIAKTNRKILFQFPRSLTRKSREINTIAKNKTLTTENLEANVIKIGQPVTTESNFKRSSAPKKSFSFFSTGSIAVLGGILGIAVAVFIVWLIRHEQRLLAVTSQRFRQLDFKPNFKLNSCIKKLSKRKKKSSPHEKNITQ